MRKILSLAIVIAAVPAVQAADTASAILEARVGATVIDYGVFSLHPRFGVAALFSPIENFRGGFVFSFDAAMNSNEDLKDAGESRLSVHHFALENQFRVWQDLWIGANLGFFSLFRSDSDGSDQLIYGDRWVAFETSLRYDFQFGDFHVAPMISGMFQGGRERPIVYAEVASGLTF
jgi:hypothetical protein